MIQQVQLVGCGREVAACQLTGFRRRHGEYQQWPLEARGAELVVPAQEPVKVAPQSAFVHCAYIERKHGVWPSEERIRIRLWQQGQTSL